MTEWNDIEVDEDTAYDEYRQRCADDGICHICEGEGCLRCDPLHVTKIEKQLIDDLRKAMAALDRIQRELAK